MTAHAQGRAEPHRLAHHVSIAAPRARVWRLVEEPEALVQWVHGLTAVKAPDGAPGGFALGATFDPDTNTFSWTPKLEDVRRHVAVFELSDGLKTTKQKVRIDVVSPLY